MRIAYAAVVGMLFLSCAGARIDTERLREEEDHPQETAMEEYESIARLEENPLDPRRATREMLLSIPGFPPWLAARVIHARGERRSGVQWIGKLTPAERETLYRFSRFLVLPQRAPMRIRARFGLDEVGIVGSERTDEYLSVENDVWVLRMRGRCSTRGETLSPYVSRMLLSSSLNLCGGDFAPDFSMGLLFNGSPYYYPFSSGFPLRARRWIVPAPSLYSEAVRGCAVQVWHGRVRGMLFAGRPRIYTGRTIEIDDRNVCGAMVCVAAGGGAVGFACRHDGIDERGPRLSGNCRWRTGNIHTAAEIIVAGPGAGAGTWGISLRDDPVDAGFVAYRVPFGSGSGFASVPGGAIRSSSWQRGCAAVVSGTVQGRSIVRVSYERYVSGDAADSREKQDIRTEIETRWKPVSLRFSYRWRLCRDTGIIPYPACDAASTTESESGHVLLVARCGPVTQVRLSSRFTVEERGNGYCIASSLRFGLFCRHVRCTAAGCLYGAITGEPVLYTYEPAFEGAYPWISVRGNGKRGTVLIDARWGGFTLSVRVFAGTGRDAGTGLMISYRR